MPRTLAPRAASDSLSNPPPQPMSRTLAPESGDTPRDVLGTHRIELVQGGGTRRPDPTTARRGRRTGRLPSRRRSRPSRLPRRRIGDQRESPPIRRRQCFARASTRSSSDGEERPRRGAASVRQTHTSLTWAPRTPRMRLATPRRTPAATRWRPDRPAIMSAALSRHEGCRWRLPCRARERPRWSPWRSRDGRARRSHRARPPWPRDSRYASPGPCRGRCCSRRRRCRVRR